MTVAGQGRAEPGPLCHRPLVEQPGQVIGLAARRGLCHRFRRGRTNAAEFRQGAVAQPAIQLSAGQIGGHLGGPGDARTR